VATAGDATAFERGAMLRRLTSERFDVLVIGGGITGAGVALDAATRGLRVALVERHDFASGTSSKSSKLVHGGLRYLQQGDVRLVYQALHERQRLLRNAPHLVSVLPFLIPVMTKDGPVSVKIAKALRSALWGYDLTGGLRIGKRHRRLGADSARRLCPTLDPARLSSAFVYYDATADDARLTLAIARTAARHGAVVVNRCPVSALRHDAGGTVVGATVDTGAGVVDVTAEVVVSATGVWADTVRRLDHEHSVATITPAKGVHINVPWHLVGNDIAVIVSVPGDKRSLFLVPWGRRSDGSFEHCYIGTTDTPYDGSLDDPCTERADVEYILAAVNRALTTTVTASDITAVWAGLRPLLAGADSTRTADMSRHHQVRVDDSGLISVGGGKLTTYRRMASDTVDVAARRLGVRRRSRTKRTPLIGAERSPSADARLHGRYGSEAAQIDALIALDPTMGRPLVPGLQYIRAEAVFAARAEMATTLDDVLLRRTRAHLHDRAACLAAADDVSVLLAAELGWTDAERRAQVAAYRALCEAEQAAMQQPQASSAAS
jgi:glycerol-3-phosphate dehydrogenase